MRTCVPPFCAVAILAAALAWGEEPQSSAKLQWYKGNTHAHSLWSDGDDFPEMIVDWYRQHGYHFLGLSDHNILADHEKWISVDDVVRRAKGPDVMDKYLARFGADWVAQRTQDDQKQVRLRTLAEFRPLFEKKGEFLLVPAEEVTASFQKKPVHVNAFNLQKLVPPPTADSVRATIRKILQAVEQQERETGEPILAHVNHPNFYWAITAEDIAHVIEDDFFEVYNGHPGVNHNGDETHAGTERIWDIANTIRLGELHAHPLFGVATDDSHTYHGRGNVNPGRGWIMVRAAELTPRALIAALRRGDFYASSGVTLRDVAYDRDTRTLRIEIAPDGDATFTTQFIGTRVGDEHAGTPAVDADGNELNDVTRRYSSRIGQVLQTAQGTSAEYRLRGDELYVRAAITSSQPHEDPSFADQKKQAWTQPVGWERHVRDNAADQLESH